MPFSKREAPNCDWCKFRSNCFYDLLDDKPAKKAWREMRLANRFRVGETVFYEGEKPGGIYVVCTGKIKIYRSSRTGQQLLIRIEYPGDLLGHIAALSQWPYAGSAEGMSESVVSMIDEDSFRRYLMKYGKASMALLREVARDVRRAAAMARDIAFKPARSRLAGTLVRMMTQPPGKRARPIVTSFKRKELAEMAGLTIETTVRLLKDFETRGLLKRKGKDIVLHDLEKLRTLSSHFS